MDKEETEEKNKFVGLRFTIDLTGSHTDVHSDAVINKATEQLDAFCKMFKESTEHMGANKEPSTDQ